MKLLRFGAVGAEKPGLLDQGGVIRDLSAVIEDFNPDTISDAIFTKIAALDPKNLPAVSGNPRIGACIAKPGKFICIGLNYSDHAAEAGMQVPPEPIIFFKATSAVCGPNDDVEIPRGSEKSDWEVELGIVIGKQAKYVTEAEALAHVAGYCVVNDVSERAFQLEYAGQWVKGKSHDTFGERVQNGSTATMVYGVAHLISYLSKFMTLQPGDIITTGTPPGVGMGMTPQRFLKPGDIMQLGVEGLGSQRQKTVQA